MVKETNRKTKKGLWSKEVPAVPRKGQGWTRLASDTPDMERSKKT
jgi:hypothetical protein